MRYDFQEIRFQASMKEGAGLAQKTAAAYAFLLAVLLVPMGFMYDTALVLFIGGAAVAGIFFVILFLSLWGYRNFFVVCAGTEVFFKAPRIIPRMADCHFLYEDDFSFIKPAGEAAWGLYRLFSGCAALLKVVRAGTLEEVRLPVFLPRDEFERFEKCLAERRQFFESAPLTARNAELFTAGDAGGRDEASEDTPVKVFKAEGWEYLGRSLLLGFFSSALLTGVFYLFWPGTDWFLLVALGLGLAVLAAPLWFSYFHGYRVACYPGRFEISRYGEAFGLDFRTAYGQSAGVALVGEPSRTGVFAWLFGISAFLELTTPKGEKKSVPVFLPPRAIKELRIWFEKEQA